MLTSAEVRVRATSRSRSFVSLFVGVAIALAAPETVLANDRVERGRALAAEADFDAAIAELAAAEQTPLDFAAYVRLLEGRALVHLGLGDRGALEADLVQLSSIDPDHAFAPDLPPELTPELARARTRTPHRLSVEPVITPVPGGVSIAGRVRDDPGSVARHVRVRARVGAGAWQEAVDRALTVPAGPSVSVEHVLVVEGPGGASLASAGSEAAPLRWGGNAATAAGVGPAVGAGGGRAAGGSSAVGGGTPGAPADEGGGIPGWLIGVGAAVVVVAVIVTILLVTAESDARPRPVVIGF